MASANLRRVLAYVQLQLFRPIFEPHDGRALVPIPKRSTSPLARRIVEEASQPGASLSAVARSYGIAARVVFRWKQDLVVFDPFFRAEIPRWKEIIRVTGVARRRADHPLPG